MQKKRKSRRQQPTNWNHVKLILEAYATLGSEFDEVEFCTLKNFFATCVTSRIRVRAGEWEKRRTEIAKQKRMEWNIQCGSSGAERECFGFHSLGLFLCTCESEAKKQIWSTHHFLYTSCVHAINRILKMLLNLLANYYFLSSCNWDLVCVCARPLFYAFRHCEFWPCQTRTARYVHTHTHTHSRRERGRDTNYTFSMTCACYDCSEREIQWKLVICDWQIWNWIFAR